MSRIDAALADIAIASAIVLKEENAKLHAENNRLRAALKELADARSCA